MGKTTYDAAYLVRNRRSAVPDDAISQSRRFLAVWRAWRDRARERRTLAGMDDRMLADIGRTRGDIVEEISRPFWRE